MIDIDELINDYLEFQILMSLCNPEVYLLSSNTVKSDILKLFKEY